MLISKLAHMRAKRGLTLSPEALIAALVPEAKKPTKLMRAPDANTHDALLRTAVDTRDPTALGVLADFLQETGMPGHGLLRAAMRYQIGADRIGHHSVWNQPGWRAPVAYEAIQWPAETFLENGAPFVEPGPVPVGHSTVSFVPHHLDKNNTRWKVGTIRSIHAPTNPHPGPHLGITVPVVSMEQVDSAIADLPDAQRAAVREHAARWLPSKNEHIDHPSVYHDTPSRLARVISYVGGDHVPGAQRAIGVWDGGAEPSNVVETDADRAAALAAQNRQKSALWFEPGPGDDSLHVFTHPGAPAEARAMLNKHGVTYATLVPGPRGTQVHVVDPGGEFDGVLPGTPQKGRATFRRL